MSTTGVPIDGSGLVIVPEISDEILRIPELGAGAGVRRDIARRSVKRTVDVVGALAAIMLSLPLLLTLFAAVRVTSRGPVLFLHRRVGRDGRSFPLVKFRTMHRRAEALLDEYLVRHSDLAEQWAMHRKLPADPRVTAVGRFLRRFSLDELPQLFNVLAGHMSLVGPRPVVEEELAYYGDRLPDILAMRPGLTGLWAVSGRSEIGYDERVELEHRYVRTWGIRRDLSILFRTIPAVFRGNGAY